MANWAVLGGTNVQGLPWRPSLTNTSTGNLNVLANQSIFLINVPSWLSITSKRHQRAKTFRCNSVPIERLPKENDLGANNSQRKTLRELCGNSVPRYILDRVEEVGFVVPTDVQEQALPVVLSGADCIIHAQTGSGKTLAYLLAIFAVVDAHRTAVQALIVVPTRELGIQVTKAARLLAASYPKNVGLANKDSINVMSLLDGGSLNRQKIWLKAEAPQVIVATLGCLCQLLEKEILKLNAIQILVTDEVDSIFGAAKQTYLLRKLLTSYTSINNRQTIFASASIPQHRQFIDNCIQQKWTKRDVVHIHVHPVEPMPSRLSHRYVICQKNEKLNILASLLQVDTPKSGIIFVNKQSEKSKRTGLPRTIDAVTEHLRPFYSKESGKSYKITGILLLEECMNINARTASLSVLKLYLFLHKMAGGREDSLWKYGIVGANKGQVQCIFCHKHMTSSVSRLKYHLAKIANKDISPCDKCPEEASREALTSLQKIAQNKEAKMRTFEAMAASMGTFGSTGSQTNGEASSIGHQI